MNRFRFAILLLLTASCASSVYAAGNTAAPSSSGNPTSLSRTGNSANASSAGNSIGNTARGNSTGNTARGNSISPSAGDREVLYRTDFEDGEGILQKGDRYYGKWESNFPEAALSIDTPMGDGNRSRRALTCHSEKGMVYVSCEAPFYGLGAVEPKGWKGYISFKVFNGGFDSFYAMYMPVIPSGVTFHRFDFNVPKGQWASFDVAVEKFLYHERRPRKGCLLERIVFVGVGPQDDKSVLQVDDVMIYRVDMGLLETGVKQILPPDVVYFQDFDNPDDFDVESYFPETRNANVFLVPGGHESAGNSAAPGNSFVLNPGWLKIECYEAGEELRGGRSFSDIPCADTFIEFDAMMAGVKDFSLVARGRTVPRMRQYLDGPRADKWTHYVVSVEDFSPSGLSREEAATQKVAKGESFFALFFRAVSDDSSQHYLLIDNMVIRRAR